MTIPTTLAGFQKPDAKKIRRLRLAAELAVMLLAVLVGLFTLNSVRGIAIGFGIIWVLLTTKLSKTEREELGLTLEQSKSTRWMLELAALVALLIWVVGIIWGPARHINYFQQNLLHSKLGYFLGAGMQQVVIQSYVFVRLKELLGCEKRAQKFTALAFAFCHLPNPLLMLISGTGGFAACWVFQRFKNVWTLALCHGIIGASMAAFWPHWTVVAGIGFIKMLFGHWPSA